MAQSTSSVNDILGQARQGSVAAIIQILNERMANSQIRTRAILADGVLQLLCEAPTPEQLEQTEVVDSVRTTLEDLAPKSIKKVNINSRIVREQQLLWLEEITRDPENQLLWSEMIKLKQPNPLVRFWQDLNQPKHRQEIPVESKNKATTQKYFMRGLVGGVSLCVLLVLLGWVLRHRLGINLSPASSEIEQVDGDTADTSATQDVFAQAVRLAQEAAGDGQEADTPAEWLDLAARWQRASELMAQVPTDSSNYGVAQDRVSAYQTNSDQALAEAERLQAAEAE